MKKIALSFLVIPLIMGTISCKKEVSPDLQVTVVNNEDEPLANKLVRVSVGGANFGILNAEVLDSGITDVFGKASFEFTNTVLVDIAVFDRTSRFEVLDSASVLLETRRLKGDENLFQKKLVIRN